MHATRTINKRSPRMVKRRNSPYNSFDRKLARRVDIDCRPKVKEIKTNKKKGGLENDAAGL
jgi:hypothetical protein